MMKYITFQILFICLVISDIAAYGADINIIDIDMLGKSIYAAPVVFKNQYGDKKLLISPEHVKLDIEEGKYTSAITYYDPKKIKFMEIYQSINSIFSEQEYHKISHGDFKVWRVVDKKTTITLSEIEFIDKSFYAISYMKWSN